jgi:hypothetical protein
MKVKILHEAGYEQALIGISLSYKKVSEDDPKFFEKMEKIAFKLSSMDDGHNKFLESIYVWLDVTAPRYWWQQADTYRVGCSKQSESTMHTLMKNELDQSNFQEPLDQNILNNLNELQKTGEFNKLKNYLPEGFLQRRIWCLNYKMIRNIIKQRKNHKLLEWHLFIFYLLITLKHSEFFDDILED